MEKSIEAIWKDGFLKSGALVAPKVNDLYNRKSKNIIEKIKRMMKINLLVLIIFSFVILIWWYLTGVPIIGTFIFLLLNAFVIYSKMQMNHLEEIDKGVSSYEYLKSYDNWVKTAPLKYAVIMRFFYPIMFLASIATIWFANGRELAMEKILIKFPDLYLVAGVPLYFILGVLLFSILMAVFAEKIYKWDVSIVYGRVFKKLEEIIADLEELRN